MHLIQICMANPALNLPASLPPGLYEVASNGRPQPAVKHGSQSTSPSQAQTAFPIQRQTTGSLQPQMTGQSFSATNNTPPRSATMTPSRQGSTTFPYNAYGVGGGHTRAGSGLTEPWDVTSDAKATSDRFFAQLDPQNKGVVEGDVAVPFMLQSQLDETTLASIWYVNRRVTRRSSNGLQGSRGHQARRETGPGRVCGGNASHQRKTCRSRRARVSSKQPHPSKPPRVAPKWSIGCESAVHCH